MIRRRLVRWQDEKWNVPKMSALSVLVVELVVGIANQSKALWMANMVLRTFRISWRKHTIRNNLRLAR